MPTEQALDAMVERVWHRFRGQVGAELMALGSSLTVDEEIERRIARLGRMRKEFRTLLGWRARKPSDDQVRDVGAWLAEPGETDAD